jgi:hypothetical protein
MFRHIARIGFVLLIALVLATAGCAKTDTPAPAPQAAAPAATEGEHSHKPAAHGGTIVAIGRDNYHAEAVFEKDGVTRLYLLGQDEAKVIEVEAQPLTAFAKPEGGTEAVSFVFRPEPQAGDGGGRASQFVGRLPRELWGKSVEVTIPAVRIGGERFRIGFANAAPHAEQMPGKVADDAERRLYLTPGGKYTPADIQANGGRTGSQKFQSFQASHDLKPKPGDWVCPVTQTKANPDCAWVIDGQTYHFCCPPCVDEFVQLAKEKPAEVRPAAEYRKK